MVVGIFERRLVPMYVFIKKTIFVLGTTIASISSCSVKRIIYAKPRRLLLFGCFVIFVLYFYLNSTWSWRRKESLDKTTESPPLIQQSLDKTTESPPLILLWNNFFNNDMSGQLRFHKNCPYECIVSTNKSLQAIADVRVFHIPNFDPKNLPVDNPDAYNVFFTLESPVMVDSSSQWKKFKKDYYFNITVSYRSNSDIYRPYESFAKLDGNETDETRWTEEHVNEHVANKTLPVLIAVSNCRNTNSDRISYLNVLKKYINVTQIGRCGGGIDCDRDCLDKLIDQSFFYLAFENSVCPEYTTEKFWRIKKLTVPVVLSRAVMSSEIPSHSYIAASDFDSPKDLADYLKFLMNNADLYKRYFDWTKYYRKTYNSHYSSVVSCQLCKFAMERRRHHTKKIYKVKWSADECIKKYGSRLLDDKKKLLEDEKQMEKLVKRTERNWLLHIK